MKIRTLIVVLAVIFGFVRPVNAQFGKNNVRYNQLNRFYESYRFDVWHNLDPNDPAQMEYLRRVVENLENARDWMGSQHVFNHTIERKIPVLLYKTHTDMESSNLVGGFMPEGVGAFVESERKRMVLKADFSKPLSRAIGVHELAHEFQFDIYNPGIFGRLAGQDGLPNGYFEGCAEFIAGLYDPHTRDDIRRREQRNYASNPKTLPTWNALAGDTVNPYTMWSMIPEFLEDKFSAGVAFCTRPLMDKVKLGEFVYDATKGELGNPDVNSEKFDQRNRYYWGTELGFEMERIDRPKPYEENDNFRGRSITPWGHPSPMLSPVLSPDGTKMAAFTVQKYGVSLVVFNIPKEEVYVSKEERQKAKDGKKAFRQNIAEELIVDLTPYLPPIPWEYLVVQGFETWSFNGFDAAWSHDGKKIAFFARINRDHALVIIDAEKGKVMKKIELPVDQAFSPSFSPDGKYIYFSAAKNITRDIYVIELESGEITNLSNDERFDTAPSVSPDGSKIVYVGSDGDFQHLFIYDNILGTKEQLTFGRFNDSSPSWSDDGTMLVYTSDEADQIWNLYTFHIQTDTVRQWTEFFGGTQTPLFARNRKDLVYYVVFRDDDQYENIIYPNFEVFEAELKKPVHVYVAQDTGPAGEFVFNPTRDLFKFELDKNQLLNSKKPPERWSCGGGNVSLGMSTYWGMFGQSFLKCSNLLETKHHVGQFVSYGSFQIFDYSYVNQEKRTTWLWGVHHSQFPLYYQFYDVINRYPNQPVVNLTWIKESSVDFSSSYPLNKFKRWEFYSRLRRRSFSIFGVDQEMIDANPEFFGENDLQFFKFLNDSTGSNLTFGTAYVRDAVLYSATTGLSGAPAPFHGDAVRLQGEYAPPLGKEFQGYLSANISARTYRHLGLSSLFAGRVDVMASSRANGDFMLLCGPDRLRGCEYGSIAGNQIGYASAELRFPIPGTYILYQNIRGFLFADAAFAKFSGNIFPAQKTKTYGFGVQYVIPFIGWPAQSIWTRDNGKWKPTFYVSWFW